MAKTVLIVTYYWPPGSSPGVQRWLKFVKYLPEFGWHPIILTVKNGSYPARDESLLEEIPDSVLTYRARSLEPFALYNALRGKKGKQVEVGMGNIKSGGILSKVANYIRANYFIPDARKGWNFFAYRKMKQILHKHEVSAVVTTGPPQSTHLMGLKLKKKYPGLPWLADFRDPWTTVYYNKLLKRTDAAEQKDKAMETEVLQTADVVSVISRGMKREFEDRAREIHVLYNGYDPDDLAEPVHLNQDHFIISYIGNFKHSQDIPAFWKALKKVHQQHPAGKKIRFKMVGNRSQAIQNALFEYGLQSICESHPFVPHKEATRLMKEAHVLYLPIPDRGNNKSIITGKIFEYLASRTPILGIGPVEGDAAALLQSCERSKMLDYKNEQAIYRRIADLLEAWVDNDMRKIEVASDAHVSLTRKAITKQLSKILGEQKEHEKDRY